MFDWNIYWAKYRETKEVRKFNIELAEKIMDIIRNSSSIKRVADYGCGPATTLFELAKKFPNIQFHGIDISSTIIKYNSKKARGMKLNNIDFIVGSIQNPSIRSMLDLIISISTLHYVRKIRESIKNMYDSLNPGGYLIFNYPNIFTKRWYMRNMKTNNTEIKERFKYVLSGENIISLKEIRKLLNAVPKKFYSSRKENVYVILRKND